MKQIMLVGQFNTTTQNVKRILDKEYKVQLGSDNIGVITGMLKMDAPDLILIFVSGMEKEYRDLFSHIQENYSGVPVIYIGTTEELAVFEDFEENGQFFKITRPVQMKTISQAITMKLSNGTETADTEPEEEEQRAAWDKKRIMVVDDSGIQRNMLKNLLKNHYDVRDCDSGSEALSMLQKWLPDLILLDYNMPGQDGKEVFEILQKEDRYREIPVVFLTGVKSRAKIQEVLGLCPAGYLLKPVEQSKLTELLTELIGM